ncbi:hypothetical protein K469DRAFT_360605 [Zopfia rhizophila CBS 207.26]|uniref:Uncharacterized protein n=1 Tax=Zopfia rhizophila CBS 207.26 TaxID=1314779 RepID=A0A6A6EJN3_9PEZI|nr:hypothetical protein K469DRAFT_360605 [Zopfia rhizophila CBS 207.26]
MSMTHGDPLGFLDSVVLISGLRLFSLLSCLSFLSSVIFYLIVGDEFFPTSRDGVANMQNKPQSTIVSPLPVPLPPLRSLSITSTLYLQSKYPDCGIPGVKSYVYALIRV